MSDIVTWLNANQGFALSLLTLLYAAATIVIVWVQIRANRLSAKNIETIVALQEERTRPSVLFWLEPRDYGFVFASVKNIGDTTAFDIRIDVEPVPKREDKRDDKEKEEIAFLVEGIASLPPGGELSTLVCRWEHLRQQNEELFFDGKVRYRSRNDNTYEEPFKIDLSAHEDLIQFRKKTVHDVADVIEKLRKDFRKVLRGSKSIAVRTISESEYQEKQKRKKEKDKEYLEKQKEE